MPQTSIREVTWPTSSLIRAFWAFCVRKIRSCEFIVITRHSIHVSLCLDIPVEFGLNMHKVLLVVLAGHPACQMRKETLLCGMAINWKWKVYHATWKWMYYVFHQNILFFNFNSYMSFHFCTCIRWVCNVMYMHSGDIWFVSMHFEAINLARTVPEIKICILWDGVLVTHLPGVHHWKQKF